MVPTGSAPSPYIPHTDADRAAMLARIGVDTIDDLFSALPANLRDPAITLPRAQAEAQVLRMLRTYAAANRTGDGALHFLGSGAYRHHIPAVVPALVSRSEFVTAYTPYQPEISQGTLQAAFEYQSVVCELTGMDVSNTGLYDVASATAEACLLALRVTERHAWLVLEPLHPYTIDVLRTYAFGADAIVETAYTLDALTDQHACVVVQQPDFLGRIVDVAPIAAAAHAIGALCIVIADPFALGMLRAPGDTGADIVTGEGRDLAGPPAYGGPSLGLFAARQQYLRQMPGRIVGRTQEVHGPQRADRSEGAPRTGYVLTLQAREQFIRRERATSNFSTGQSLVALAFTIAVQTLGPHGLRTAAEYAYQSAHEAAVRIAALPGYAVVESHPWFQEFLVRAPMSPGTLAQRLHARGIVGGLDVSLRDEPEAENATLFCITEATPPAHISALVDALAAIGAAS